MVPLFNVTVTGGKLDVTVVIPGFGVTINGLTITVNDTDENLKITVTNAFLSFTKRVLAAYKQDYGKGLLQILVNTNQNINLDISNMNTSVLEVIDIKVSTTE